MEKNEILSRFGCKFVYELKPGETWAVFNGSIVVCHPERPPKIVYLDTGTEEEITLG